MGIMQELIAALGVAWTIAVGLEFLTIIMESAAGGAGKSVDSENGEPPKGLAKTLVMFASSLCTVFLFVHVLFHATSSGIYITLLIAGIGVVAGIVLVGGLIGALLARTPVRGLATAIQFPVALVTLGATLFATLPTAVTFLRLYFGVVLPF